MYSKPPVSLFLKPDKETEWVEILVYTDQNYFAIFSETIKTHVTRSDHCWIYVHFVHHFTIVCQGMGAKGKFQKSKEKHTKTARLIQTQILDSSSWNSGRMD